MKSLFQFLSILLCLEFIIGPMQGSLLISSASAQTKSCPTGQTYDSSVNRCLTNAEVIRVNEAVRSCGQDRGCYRTNAENALQNRVSTGSVGTSDSVLSRDDNKGNSGLAKAGNAVAIGIPLIIVTSVLIEKSTNKHKNAFSCSPPSLLLMYGAAAALGVGEMYGWLNHKSRLKKIKDEWDRSVVPDKTAGVDRQRSEATEAQSQAFEFLAQNEDQVAQTTKTKKGFYIAATGLFAAGMVAAIVEKVQLKAAVASLGSGNPATIAQAKLTISKLTCGEDARSAQQAGVDDQKTLEDRAAAEAAEKAKTSGAATTANSPTSGAPSSTNGSTGSPNNSAGANETITKSSTYVEGKNADGNYFKRTSTSEVIEGTPAVDPIELRKPTLPGIPTLRTIPGTPPTKPSIPTPTPPPSPFSDGETPPTGGYNSKELEKVKRVAAYNISTAKDAEQLLQLIKEFDSVEFENYSKVSYLGEEEARELKEIPLVAEIAQSVTNAILPSSYAQAKGGAGLAAVGGLLPMVGLLKELFGGIKTQGDKAITPAELTGVANTTKNFVVRAIAKPVTRIAINGVLGGWMGIMSIHMNKQQKLSESRAKKLREMAAEFASANGIMNCTEEQRNDPAKPKCFCFTPENKVNPARANKLECKNALALLPKKSGNIAANDKVCVTQSMAMDSACSCRAKNTCLKVGAPKVGFSPATFKMMNASAGPANDLFKGALSGGDIADSAGINAARVRASAEAMLDKTDPKAAKDSKAAASALEKGLIASASGLSMGGSSNAPLPSSPAAAAAALDKELKEDKAVSDNSNKSFSPSGNYANEPAPEFGLGAQEAASQEIEIAEVMGKEVDFGTSDINKAPDTNIFEVLSNRYQRSGMKRLLEPGDQTPADAPSNTDISD